MILVAFTFGNLDMNSSRESRKPGVLVIDDETEILDVIKITLETEGYNVFTASRPSEGLRIYEERWHDIDLVLLDYLMPDMTGDLVFECLQRTNASVRVLLLTGCDDNVAKRMFESGLRGYMQKPFYLDDLIQRVREEIEAD